MPQGLCVTGAAAPSTLSDVVHEQFIALYAGTQIHVRICSESRASGACCMCHVACTFGCHPTDATTADDAARVHRDFDAEYRGTVEGGAG